MVFFLAAVGLICRGPNDIKTPTQIRKPDPSSGFLELEHSFPAGAHLETFQGPRGMVSDRRTVGVNSHNEKENSKCLQRSPSISRSSVSHSSLSMISGSGSVGIPSEDS